MGIDKLTLRHNKYPSTKFAHLATYLKVVPEGLPENGHFPSGSGAGKRRTCRKTLGEFKVTRHSQTQR